MTSYNTGTTASANTASSVEVVIPSGVEVGDVIWLPFTCFTEDSSEPTISISGGGGEWTLAEMTDGSQNPQVTSHGSVYGYGFLYWRVATSGDPGATLTISESGSSGSTTWWATAPVSYTGADTSSPIDVAGAASAAGDTEKSITCPSLTTSVNGDWALFFYLGGYATALSGPSGSTQREQITSSAEVSAAVYDSNGSVGSSGTAIGGGTFSTTGSEINFYPIAFTVGLAPVGTPHTATASLTDGEHGGWRKKLLLLG